MLCVMQPLGSVAKKRAPNCAAEKASLESRRKSLYAPVLRSRRTVQVDDDLEIVILRPSDSLAKIGKLALDVRLVALNVPSPVTDGKTDVIETDM